MQTSFSRYIYQNPFLQPALLFYRLSIADCFGNSYKSLKQFVQFCILRADRPCLHQELIILIPLVNYLENDLSV